MAVGRFLADFSPNLFWTIMENKQDANILMTSIDVFPWNEHFNTGILKIDEQHQKLVQLLNRLASHMAFQSDKETLDIVFQELTAYAVYHFETEEAIWHEYLHDSSIEAAHKAEHDNFVLTVLSLKSKENSNSVASMIEKMLSFLVSWLASHILENDKYMALVVLTMQTGISQEEAESHARNHLHGQMSVLIKLILSTYGSLATNTIQLMTESVERKQAEKKLQTFANQLKKSFQHLDLANKNLEKQYIDSIRAFSRIIEMRPGIKSGQSKYIAEKALLVARELNVEKEQSKSIFYAGLLIQLGKMSLPDNLLLPAYFKIPLAEKTRYLKHAIDGEALLNGLTQLKEASKFIRHQYEFYDGTGFPDGLANQNIPLGSRILSVVRDYIAYLEGSITGEAMSVRATIDKLMELKSSHYDPDIVDSFIRILKATPVDEEFVAELPKPKKSWKNSKLMNSSKTLTLERPIIEISLAQLKPGMEIESVYFDSKPYLKNCVLDQKIINNITSLKENTGKDPIIKIHMGKR